MIYLVGGNGFVGSAFARLFAARGLEFRIIGRDDFEDYRGTSCEVLINANGNSKKYLADREPMTDFDLSVRSVAKTIEAFRCGIYALLSTGDVYADQSRPELTREDQAIDPVRQGRYGLHKMLAETLVCATQTRWLILRMGGLVGPGLKKNAIYDMLAGTPVWLSAESELQFLSTDRAAQLVWRLVERGVAGEIVNLGAMGLVRLADLHRRIGSTSPFRCGAPTVRYELSLEKLAMLAGEPLPESRLQVESFLTGRPAEPDDRSKSFKY
jgi:nucleoside-diphosphate-sugar epimerase